MMKHLPNEICKQTRALWERMIKWKKFFWDEINATDKQFGANMTRHPQLGAFERAKKT